MPVMNRKKNVTSTATGSMKTGSQPYKGRASLTAAQEKRQANVRDKLATAYNALAKENNRKKGTGQGGR